MLPARTVARPIGVTQEYASPLEATCASTDGRPPWRIPFLVTCFIGPEPEFFIFDEVRYEQNQHRGYYEIDSVPAHLGEPGRLRHTHSGYSRLSRR